jgi:hypothetical protein
MVGVSDNANKRLIQAAITLDADPSAQVLCPRCGEGYLRVQDSEPMPDGVFERILSCAECGGRSFARMHVEVPNA